MAVLTRPLSASEVQKAKPADKDYELFDGQGLTLFIRTNGKKSGAFRYKRPGSTARTTITPRTLPCHVACQRPNAACRTPYPAGKRH